MPHRQLARANKFRALHAETSGFLIPNPWDWGSARLLAQLGFMALATTSAGFSCSRGKPDRSASRESMLSHLADMASATDLPLSDDLESVGLVTAGVLMVVTGKKPPLIATSP